MVFWEARLQSFLVPCEHNCEDRFLVRGHLQEPSAPLQHSVLYDVDASPLLSSISGVWRERATACSQGSNPGQNV